VIYPIIFKASFDGHLKTIAAYKHPPETGRTHWVSIDYYETDWTNLEIRWMS